MAIANSLLYYRFIDLKVQMQATDYGNFLQNEPSPIPVTTIDEKLRSHLVVEFTHIRNQSVEPLSTFLDYITWEKGHLYDSIDLSIVYILQLWVHDRQHHSSHHWHPPSKTDCRVTEQVSSTWKFWGDGECEHSQYSSWAVWGSPSRHSTRYIFIR